MVRGQYPNEYVRKQANEVLDSLSDFDLEGNIGIGTSRYDSRYESNDC